MLTEKCQFPVTGPVQGGEKEKQLTREKAMFRSIFTRKSNRKSFRPTTSFRPTFETLEDRLVMSTVSVRPVIKVPVVNQPSPVQAITSVPNRPVVQTPPPNPFASAQALDLVTVPRQVLSEPLTSTTSSHLYSFHLEQSDLIEIDVHAPANVRLKGLLSVLDSQDTVLASQTNQSPAILFQAAAAGSYY